MGEHLFLGKDEIWPSNPYFDIPVAVFDEGILSYPEELEDAKSRVSWSLSDKGYIGISERPPFQTPMFEWVDRSSTVVNTADGSRYVRVAKPFFQNGESKVPKDVRLGNEDTVYFVTSESLLEQRSPFCYVLKEEQLLQDFSDPDLWVNSRKNIARIVHAGLDDELLGEETSVGQTGSRKQEVTASGIFEDFEAIRQYCKEHDKQIRRLIRDLENMEDRAEVVYRDMLDRKLQDQDGISLDDILGDLNKNSLSEEAFGFRDVEPDLVMEIQDSMESMTFQVGGDQLDVSDPELVWDCHCVEPRGYFAPENRPRDANQYDCPIHDREIGDEVTARFNNGLVEIRYKGVDSFWFNSRNFWPPSVDSIQMCENLRSEGLFDDYVTSVLDMGCGTGFLGMQLAKHNPNVEELYLLDWLLAPLVMSKVNWELNRREKRHVSCKPRLGLGFEWAQDELDGGETADVLVCNPPYLPALDEFPKIKMGHTVAGTELLETVIADGQEYADEVYVHFSDIAEEEAVNAASEAGVELEQIGEKQEVPFRVEPALEHPEYIDKLVNRGLHTYNTGRYKYWHDIATYRIET